MPASARPLLHSGASIQSSGPVVDPAFTAAEFDVKAWINAALEFAPLQQQQGGNPDSSSKNGPSPLSASHGELRPSATVDTSLDASLDLLQTPALDPVLGKYHTQQPRWTTHNNALSNDFIHTLTRFYYRWKGSRRRRLACRNSTNLDFLRNQPTATTGNIYSHDKEPDQPFDPACDIASHETPFAG